MFIEWSKSLEIGIDFVDADHKILINLLNQVNDCVEQHEEGTVVGSVLDALVDYTDYHFFREEKMLEACGYLDILEHQGTHKDLSAQVHRIYTDYNRDPWDVDPQDILAFLKSWLTDHILGHDFAYKSLCSGHSEASTAANKVSFYGGKDQEVFADWHDLRVMLVDDNPNFRKLIHTLLKAVGVRHIQLVDNAKDGIARLSHRPTDVVLCDMVMDGMNGIDFARHMQTMNVPTKIVMMTGLAVNEIRDRTTGLGVSGYLEKPIKAQSFLETIAGVVTAKVAAA